MRGLKKTAPDGAHRQTDKQTDGHADSKTNSAQRGRVGDKQKQNKKQVSIELNICSSWPRTTWNFTDIAKIFYTHFKHFSRHPSVSTTEHKIK